MAEPMTVEAQGAQAGVFELSQELNCHSAAVRCVVVLKNGTIVTGGMDKLVCMWTKGGGSSGDASMGEGGGDGGGENGGTNGAANGTSNGYTLEKSLQHHQDYIYCLADASESNHFYSSSREPIIYKLDYEGSPNLQFTGHEGAVNSLVDRGNQLFSGSWDGSCRIWDNSSGEMQTKIQVS
jgi:WD40 repeat protein